jgi:hypothetical protein
LAGVRIPPSPLRTDPAHFERGRLLAFSENLVASEVADEFKALFYKSASFLFITENNEKKEAKNK